MTCMVGRRSRPRTGMCSLAIAGVLVPLILACGATPPQLKKAPASQLELQLTFDGVFSQGVDARPPGTVGIFASFGTAKGAVLLGTRQTLVCDGVSLPIGPYYLFGQTHKQPLLRRQPPGGAYTCVYTDERGQRTTVTIPVPTGTLAITNPLAGASVRVPPPLPHATPEGVTPLLPYYGTPEGGTPVVTGRGRVRRAPLIISYTMPALPPGGHATVEAIAGCPRNPGEMGCDTGYGPSVYGPPSAAQGGTFVLADEPEAGPGFASLMPGPGYVTLSFTMDWSLPPQGFQDVHVVTHDSVTNTVVWTASQS